MLELRSQVCGCCICREGELHGVRESLLLCMCFYESPESSLVGAVKGHIRVVNESLLGVLQRNNFLHLFSPLVAIYIIQVQGKASCYGYCLELPSAAFFIFFVAQNTPSL